MTTTIDDVLQFCRETQGQWMLQGFAIRATATRNCPLEEMHLRRFGAYEGYSAAAWNLGIDMVTLQRIVSAADHPCYGPTRAQLLDACGLTEPAVFCDPQEVCGPTPSFAPLPPYVMQPFKTWPDAAKPAPAPAPEPEQELVLV